MNKWSFHIVVQNYMKELATSSLPTNYMVPRIPTSQSCFKCIETGLNSVFSTYQSGTLQFIEHLFNLNIVTNVCSSHCYYEAEML